MSALFTRTTLWLYGLSTPWWRSYRALHALRDCAKSLTALDHTECHHWNSRPNIYLCNTPPNKFMNMNVHFFFYDNCKADLTINLKAISTKFSDYLKYSGQIRFKKKKEPTSSREMSNNLILKAPSMNTKVVEYCFNMELNENICF